MTDHPTTLDNWSLVYRDPVDSYTAPELVRPCLSGRVSGDTRFKDGETITTGTLIWRRSDVIATKRTLYRLGTVDPAYEAAFPNARERLYAAVKEATPPTLHIYLIDDGEQWHYAAASAEAALALFVEDNHGGTVEGYRSEYPDTTIDEQPDDRTLTVGFEDPPEDEDHPARTMTMREWAAERGEGLVCSTCF